MEVAGMKPNVVTYTTLMAFGCENRAIPWSFFSYTVINMTLHVFFRMCLQNLAKCYGDLCVVSWLGD